MKEKLLFRVTLNDRDFRMSVLWGQFFKVFWKRGSNGYTNGSTCKMYHAEACLQIHPLGK